jgi:TetR/AcrR family transcriptional regulator, regulator of cefoperazone and chloramphenicol sensitivity
MMGPDQTRARLLEAAGEEFAEKGFEGATIRSICARAEANLAAVNYHFGDKEQLYTQAVLEAHRCCVQPAAETDPADGDPAEQLRDQIHHFLSNVLAVGRTDDWHRVLLLREMIRPSPASETLVREVIRPRFERLAAIVRRIRPDLAGRRLHATVFSIVGQCLHYKLARPIAERIVGPAALEALDVEFLTGHITAFTLAALAAGAPDGREAS